MDLDARGVERDRFDLDAHDLRSLQLLEHAIKYTGLGPAVHARVDGVPVAKPLGQSAPLAAMLGHIEDRIDHLQVAQADVATLPGQTVLNRGELLGCDLHASKYPSQSMKSQLVLTRPSQFSAPLQKTVAGFTYRAIGSPEQRKSCVGLVDKHDLFHSDTQPPTSNTFI